MKQKLNLESIINFLLETELFCDLTPIELSEIASIMDIQKFKKGEMVFSEGDIGDGWYVLYEGEVIVSKHIPFQKDKSVATLQISNCFGEMAIIDSTPRSATIVAKDDIVVFRFPRRKFEKLLEEGQLAAYKLIYGMARVLVDRQRELNHQVMQLAKELEDIEAELDFDRSDVFDRTDLFRL